jgi:hypothetical protein
MNILFNIVFATSMISGNIQESSSVTINSDHSILNIVSNISIGIYDTYKGKGDKGNLLKMISELGIDINNISLSLVSKHDHNSFVLDIMHSVVSLVKFVLNIKCDDEITLKYDITTNNLLIKRRTDTKNDRIVLTTNLYGKIDDDGRVKHARLTITAIELNGKTVIYINTYILASVGICKNGPHWPIKKIAHKIALSEINTVNLKIKSYGVTAFNRSNDRSDSLNRMTWVFIEEIKKINLSLIRR